jgi:hypothetical protein
MVLKPFIFFLHFLLLLERLVSGRRSKIVDKKTDVGPTTSLSTEKLEGEEDKGRKLEPAVGSTVLYVCFGAYPPHFLITIPFS